MRVLGVNTTGTIKLFFDEMYAFEQRIDAIAQGDFIICVFPVTEQTINFITEKELSHMKPTAYFMNIGRAELIDEQHVVKTLKFKRIS